jgi:Right handed beta helix region
MRRMLPAAVAGLLLAAAPALAHVERTAYWPDPRPDTSVSPPAGGAVPQARSLASALGKAGPGKTRVVCQAGSLRAARREIAAAQASGYRLRPTAPLRRLSASGARTLTRVNEHLFSRCRYQAIQPAVTASTNDDRVVIMPGVYTEPASRAVPAFPEECEQYRATSDHGAGAVSYEYQFHCPNAQALVAVIGRALGPGQDPPSSPTSRPDPHGIPNLGRCIRCNLQIEGSGPTPDDVVIDAGRVASGNGAPLGSAKDVGLKADRADGIVIRNMTVRHAAEHDVYVLETDGYVMDRMKYFYAGEYGALMFTSDHGLTENCEGAGNGDSAVYPGGAPDTGVRRDTRFYPEQRLNQEITRCDLHHNNMATSGTMGNAVHIDDNEIYDNASGLVTDSFYAGGHPGFPQDSTVFEHNRVYSNNFDVYGPDSDVKSVTPVPIGVGLLIAGGDDDIVRDNLIYDNWRRGTMLLAVPDAVACAPNADEGAPPCQPQGVATTSNDNRFYGNVMGRAPDGARLPNGVDFWWDEFPSNTGNCWYPNTGADGSAASVTGDPAPPPVPGSTVPGSLPEDCGSPLNVGTGDAAKEAMLVDCAENGNDGICEWYQEPARPGSAAAAAQAAEVREDSGRIAGLSFTSPFCTLIGGEGGTLTCSPFRYR